MFYQTLVKSPAGGTVIFQTWRRKSGKDKCDFPRYLSATYSICKMLSNSSQMNNQRLGNKDTVQYHIDQL